MSLISFSHLSFIYNKKDPNHYDALSDINFEIEKGDFIALVGKTGSGKSTLIQTINGLLKPTSGFTKVLDYYVSSDKNVIKKLKKEKGLKNKDFKDYSKLRKEVGIVFQFPEYQLFAETVLKDVMFGPKNFGMKEEEAKNKAIQALNEVGIDESYYSRSPFELSGGEKRRVAIAGIIASSPQILILDEPTVGLDPNGKREILSLIDKIYQNGTTIIIVTHDMDLVMNHAKKAAILKDSKLLKITTPSELFNSDNIEDYSLEIPTFYKFKNLLKEKHFSLNIDDINDLPSLVEKIKESYK